MADPPPWQVRICRIEGGTLVGAGVLIEDFHVITCAHVVSADTSFPETPVFAEFQFAAKHRPIPAQVIGWYPERDDRSGDVAVLKLLVDELPHGAECAHLRYVHSEDRFR